MRAYSKIFKILAALCLLAGGSAQSAELVLGTYNIRTRTLQDKTDDPATNRYWDIRADRVVQTVKDGNFDVIGFNELTDDPRHDGHTMMQDMLRNFPADEWGWAQAQTIPGNRDASYIHSIMFRKSVIELLDQGNFWIGPDPTKSQSGVWDHENQIRMTVWAKLKVKATGEIFYFFETHLHHQGDIGKNEGSRLNVDFGREISGPYPAFICGDHNSTEPRTPFYDLYSAYYDDSFKVAKTKDGSEGTNNVWKGGTLKRLDYVWAKNAAILDYSTIQEKYGADFYPSDHFPVRVKVRLLDPVENMDIYVDASAAAGGDGSLASPFSSLRQAVEAAPRGATLRVAKGEYDAGQGVAISRSLDIVGGYDSGFSRIEGISTIRGDKAGCANVLTVDKGAALRLANACVTGGSGKNPGSGIRCDGPRLILENVRVEGNESRSTGAGVYAYGQLIADNCVFTGNTTTGIGGAVYCDSNGSAMQWRHSFTDCSFSANKALDASAVYLKGTGWANFLRCAFYDNTATMRATVHLCGNKADPRITFYNCTFASNRVTPSAATGTDRGGSAILIDKLKPYNVSDATGATVSIANNTIIGNIIECESSPADGYQGAAVMALNGVGLYLNNNIIAGNISPATVSDVWCADNSSLQTDNSKYNIYGAKSTVSFPTHKSDYYASTPEEAMKWLDTSMDASFGRGKIFPTVKDNGGKTPTVAIVNPKFGEKDLNSLKSTRFVEINLNGDLNGDVQIRKANTADIDQRGFPRAMSGTASYGSFEYNAKSAIEAIPADSQEVEDAPALYYNLSGIRVDAPSEPGVYIMRRGSQSQKILISK